MAVYTISYIVYGLAILWQQRSDIEEMNEVWHITPQGLVLRSAIFNNYMQDLFFAGKLLKAFLVVNLKVEDAAISTKQESIKDT